MDSGSLASMSHMQHNAFRGPSTLGVPGAGLASRRGGQGLKPLSLDAGSGADKDPSIHTPRTSRSHLLAGLRTAPKSATAATFPPSPTTASVPNQHATARNGALAPGVYGSSADSVYNGPKTSMPRFAQVQTYNNSVGNASRGTTYGQQHYTPEQILAPPEIHIDERESSGLDADYAELVATNMYLAAQKQRLQQQLMTVQAAQQQFQTLSLGGVSPQQTLQQATYQQLLYQQQQLQLQQQQQQQQQFAVVDPLTGQQTLYVGQGAAQLNSHFVDQYNANMQQLQHLQLLQQQLQIQQQQQLQQQQQQQQQFHQHYPQQHRQASPITAPRVQVSPPPGESGAHGARNPSPPRRFEATLEAHAPLPPPSANAFRRGHKKATSLVGAPTLEVGGGGSGGAVLGYEPPKSAGPKTTSFPANALQPMGTYGPGQGRAGEHPVRQPRGPPSFDELAQKPTSKHEGSKNFATRTRRSAVSNLVRAGFSRRQGTGNGSGSVGSAGSTGSFSPISETAEEVATPLTDDESVSGHSGSGSLNGDEVECSLPSSRTSTGSWGAIGSERPGSRENARKSVESLSQAAAAGASDGENGGAGGSSSSSSSFASVFRSAASSAAAAAAAAAADGAPRPRLVLTNGEKRRLAAA